MTTLKAINFRNGKAFKKYRNGKSNPPHHKAISQRKEVSRKANVCQNWRSFAKAHGKYRIGTHSNGRQMCFVSIDGTDHTLKLGDSFIVPAEIKHQIRAIEDFRAIHVMTNDIAFEFFK